MKLKRHISVIAGLLIAQIAFADTGDAVSGITGFLGRLHPMILHLPIGAILLVFFLDVAGRVKKTYPKEIVRKGLAFSSFFAILAAVFGYFLSLEGGYEEKTLNLHLYTGILTALLITVLFLMSLSESSAVKRSFFPCFVLTLIAITVAGHYGSVLTHGSDFLTEHLQSKPEPDKVATVDSLHYFNDIVYPILDNKCISCHNPEKKKGDLSLKTMSEILKGGENGKVISAGDSKESMLVKVLHLPLEDDHHMPPKGKKQVTEEEAYLLSYWIDHGADFNNKVVAYQKNDTINKLLEAYVVEEEVEPEEADLADIRALIDNGFRVQKIVADKSFLSVKYLPKKIDKNAMRLLENVAEQVKELDLGGSDFNDDLGTYLEAFKNVRFLKLDNTLITDKVLVHLEEISKLKILNLHNTEVSEKGLSLLLEKVQPEKMYVWNTKMDDKALAMIAKSSNVELISGVFEGFTEDATLNPPEFNSNKSVFLDTVQVKLSSQVRNVQFYYTTDGSDPDSDSEPMPETLLIEEPLIFKAKAFKNDWLPSPVVTREYFKVKYVVEDFQLEKEPNKKYPGSGKLFDLVEGTTSFSDGKWAGFEGDDMVAEITLGEAKELENITISCLEDVSSWIFFPKSISVYTKDENGNYTKLSEQETSRRGDIMEDKKQRFTLNFPKTAIKNLKIVVNNYGKLPKWHDGAGSDAWLFIDEVLIW
ncbi:c-type cytochrome domain-containing protein [Zhouia amylolytica]|uniref:Uncharacterized protein n=1 Tax=Zhouia amylolytica AD3 TaxID=1286632 RepID=W2UK09_9FLAO|nr:c-type cytochrome domain-containing protein [Zhouia amylolytica]ETN94314.1 hypothetical protein P278_22560 [Zhouia amylolytica AD3]